MINSIRTLDQSYYHMLPSTLNRDKDQVVSRWAKRKSKRAKERLGNNPNCRKNATVQHNILMVDQLWLWRIHGRDKSEPDIVITCFPSRKGVQAQTQAQTSREVDNLQENILQNRNIHQRGLIKGTSDLVSRILTECCQTLDRHQHLQTVDFLQMFQSTIGETVRDSRDELILIWS
jgi:hypothetical protein